MLHFLQPIWLFAAAAVLVPVLIHLWNIRRGKLLMVGSTLLMSVATRKSASSLRISQWLLLLLRCLLIIVLSLLLAGPQWRTGIAAPAKGWVLIEKQHAAGILKQFAGGIDSLKKVGFETRQFAPGFEFFTANDTVAIMTGSGLQRHSYWSLINQLDDQLPAGFPVYLFTGDKLVDLAITPADTNHLVHYPNPSAEMLMPRPVVSIQLHWETIDTPPIADTAIVRSRKLAGGNIEATYLRSDANGNYFIKTSAASANGADTGTTRIAVYHDPTYTDDVRYLEAALNAISAFGKYNMEIIVTGNVKSIPDAPDWLFWLSEQEPVVNNAQHLFRYMPGKAERQHSWIRMQDGPAPENAVSSFRIINAAVPNSSTTIWEDGYGNPILTSGGNVHYTYHFYSRFSPAWSDLTWHPSFPQIIMKLIFSDQPEKLFPYDQRRFSKAESMPEQVSQTPKQNKAAFAIVDLDKLCWLLAFLLFAIERILSVKNQNRVRS